VKMKMRLPTLMIIWFLLGAFLGGCYPLRATKGGGQTDFQPPRPINAADIKVPEGYRVELVAGGLTFPTGVAFDDVGQVYVVEAGYSYHDIWTVPRLLRITPEGLLETVAEGGGNGPWTGVAFHQSNFFVAEGGSREGGRILSISSAGRITVLVENIPSRGDHHTNGPIVGPDGLLYFGVGVATNSGVVGGDNFDFGWLERFPDFHDVACKDVVLAGVNYETPDFLHPDGEMVETGAFLPFGTPSGEGQVIRGRVPCGSGVHRVDPAGGEVELVAWGFRNPFGFAVSPGDRIYVTDNQYDLRGSRPVFGAGDLLWELQAGVWYGWPDFHGERPLYEEDLYRPPGHHPPARLLADHPARPPAPVAIMGVHSSANGFDFSRSADFGHQGQAFIAQFGDMVPGTGKVLAPAGFKVVRVDVATGVIHDFAVNSGPQNGPASLLGTGGLERPVAARFSPDGSSLYLVDFGVMLMSEKGPLPQAGTGVLWRIVRDR
jgi:glucose/arabinose dehydrogenase